MFTPRNVFEWLDEVRARPGMYLGVREAPLRDLQALVHGYNTALYVHGIVENVPSMAHLSTWLRLTRGWSMSLGWAHAVQLNAPEGSELETLFGLTDEYRLLQPTTVASVTLDQRRRSLERPDAIRVVRYQPLPIHVLRLAYGTRIEERSALHDAGGSYATTLELAKDQVREEFGIEPHEWTAA